MVLDRALSVLNRSFLGNITEIKDRTREGKLQRDDNSRALIDFGVQIAELDSSLQQETVTGSLRHNSVESKLSQFDRTFSEFSDVLLRHDRAVDWLNWTQASDRNQRSRTDAELKGSIESLRESLSGLNNRFRNSQDSFAAHQQSLNKLNLTFARKSGMFGGSKTAWSFLTSSVFYST